MPGTRKGPAYPISKEWRTQVREAIDDIINDDGSEITSDAKFANHAGIAKSSLSEALLPTSVQSVVMPEINAALGWRAPRLLSTPDELEVWAVVEALSDLELGRFLGRSSAAVTRVEQEAARRRRRRRG